MGLSVVLDVFLGLALLYLLLSLLVTTLNEIVITTLRFRARNLQTAIVAIINDSDVRELFYSNGLIATSQTASRGGKPATPGAAGLLSRAKASMLPAEPVAPKPAPEPTRVPDAQPGKLADGEARNPAEVDRSGNPADFDHPSYFDSRIFAKALLASVGRAKGIGDIFKIDDARAAIEKLPPGNLRDVLLAQLGDAAQTLDQLEKNVARWFDVTMDRLSGDFMRLSKRWALLIGMLVALVANADSIAVGRALSGSPELRKQVADTAAKLIAPDATGMKPCDAPVGSKDETKVAPAAKPGAPDDPKTTTKSDPQPQVDTLGCLARRTLTLQSELAAFPIGWSGTEAATLSFGGWLLKLIGIAWTGLALSLGAPFWFDMLQKIMSIRGAGPKPTTEAEKDKKAADVAR